MAGGKSDVGEDRNGHSTETAQVSLAPTIHEAQLASGPSGAVEYGLEIDEPTAVAREGNGEDIIVRGNDTKKKP